MDLQLNNNWNVLADPFYAMKGRTQFNIAAVSKLIPGEAITAVMGEKLAGRILSNNVINAASSVQASLFAAWCYLRLRQTAQLTFPIELDEVFYFADHTRNNSLHIAGLDVLKQYGRFVQQPSVLGTAMSQYRSLIKDGEIVKRLAHTHGLEEWCVRQALLTGVYANLGVEFKLLTYALARPVIEQVFGVQDRIVYVDHNWTRCFDFNATQADVAVVIDWLAGALCKGGVSPIQVSATGEDGFSVWIDEYEFRVTAKDGVFEVSRNLRFNNMLLVSSLTGRGRGVRIPAEDMSLVNSYGTFLYGLVMLGAKYLTAPVPELGQLVSKKMFVELPVQSDDEAQAYDGDRAYYDRYVTVTRLSATDMPFGFARYQVDGEWNTKVIYNREIGVTSLGDVEKNGVQIKGAKLPAKHVVDRSALLGFNLVRMPRGQFIDGRRSCIQAKHVPSELREQFVREVLSQLTDNTDAAIAEYARQQFGLSGSDEEVIKTASQHLIIGLSSKLAKLIKRTAMDAACVGLLEGGSTRGLKRFGQPVESGNNWVVEAVVSPHATFPAGMAVYWGEGPTLLVKHTQTVQPNVPGVIKEEELAGAVVSLVGGQQFERRGWQVIRMEQPLRIADKEPICDVPYITEEGCFRHTITNNTPDAYLLEIRWRLAKVAGNHTTLQVVLVTQTREHQIKGRNNIKCMLSRYTPDVVHNNLNAELNARSVFFADTNKWLDLVQSIAHDLASYPERKKISRKCRRR